jgi:hypothetical protein
MNLWNTSHIVLYHHCQEEIVWFRICKWRSGFNSMSLNYVHWDILVEENVCLYIEFFLKNPILENTQDGEKWEEIELEQFL